jgi:hypothetical protein
MGFKRVWDSTCPRQWDKWENDGNTWIIQDLPPEDDEKALQILMEHMVPDEPMCIANSKSLVVSRTEQENSTSLFLPWLS